MSHHLVFFFLLSAVSPHMSHVILILLTSGCRLLRRLSYIYVILSRGSPSWYTVVGGKFKLFLPVCEPLLEAVCQPSSEMILWVELLRDVGPLILVLV